VTTKYNYPDNEEDARATYLTLSATSSVTIQYYLWNEESVKYWGDEK